MIDWVEKTEPLAYGYLHLKPEEFLDLQVNEFYKIFDGYQQEEKHRDQKTAYFLSWLVNTQIQNPVSADAILAPLYPKTPQEIEQKRKKDEEALKQEFGLE